jgi:hypothetical protein
MRIDEWKADKRRQLTALLPEYASMNDQVLSLEECDERLGLATSVFTCFGKYLLFSSLILYINIIFRLEGLERQKWALSHRVARISLSSWLRCNRTLLGEETPFLFSGARSRRGSATVNWSV